jgi:hypothetical protein
VSTTLDPSWEPKEGSLTFDPGGRDGGRYFARITFLDDEPMAVLADLRASPKEQHGRSVVEIYESVLLPITAWDWSWFDR